VFTLADFLEDDVQMNHLVGHGQDQRADVVNPSGRHSDHLFAFVVWTAVRVVTEARYVELHSIFVRQLPPRERRERLEVGVGAGEELWR
jgi:hypothetical protein